MLDPKLLRTNTAFVAKELKRRGYLLDVDAINSLENNRKKLQLHTQQLQSLQNKSAKHIGYVKGGGGDTSLLLKEVNDLKFAKQEAENSLCKLKIDIDFIFKQIPNLLSPEVPEGKEEKDNFEVMRWKEPRLFDFEIKDHVDIGEHIGGLDFKTAAKITGSRFSIMSRDIARLHRSIIQFMLDTHCDKHGYDELNVPYIVNEDSLYGTGQLPKFKEDLFKLQGDKNYYLIPTAEVPVTNIMRNEVIQQNELPLKFVCHSPCFRSEAGSAGRDVRGLIRQHQFEKVELVQFVIPDNSSNALEQLTLDAEDILQKLDLPYRKMMLCAGDVGFSACKTYDLEVWIPSQGTYREISSCSNFGDFQARRMKACYRNAETGKLELLHTINGSGLAVGRTLVAILENFQQSDGSIEIPFVLQKYMGGKSIIKGNT